VKFKIGDRLKSTTCRDLFVIIGYDSYNYLIKYPSGRCVKWDIIATEHLWNLAINGKDSNHPNTNIFKF
jgi:hypothetical protein